MNKIFETALYPYVRSPDQDKLTRRKVVVIGAGPVGVALAIDLAQRGTEVVVLDDNDKVSTGSRAICFAKRTLEIADRLGAGAAMVAKGVQWNVGKVFFGAGQIYGFNLLAEDGHKQPAFINLQQYYAEQMLVDRALSLAEDGAPLEIRGRNRVIGLENRDDHVRLTVETPDGPYPLEAEYVVACDGAKSPSRGMLGLDFDGRVFEDNFLIADVKMKADFPTERWFWFEPPFEGAGQSALLHKQPDDVWRIDFQLGWDIDRDAELDPTRIRARVDAMLSSQAGYVPEYELEWTSIYTFQCRRMARFRDGRVLFAGDAAHQVSPFGARGANSGIQDADNLGWKLDLVLRGAAGASLLDSYTEEREFGADENILNSTRATDFMTPKTDVSKLFRNAVLELAEAHEFARPLVNSGRLSVPCVYDRLGLTGEDDLRGPAAARPGAVCPDAPLKDGYVLDHLNGDFVLLGVGCDVPQLMGVDGISLPGISVSDLNDAVRDRYLGDAAQAVYLVRPDQHVVARWRKFDKKRVVAALRNILQLEAI